ncbi:MAG: hypothetical protein IJX90_01205 [Blautia sp.]|nr:hypothetical protein [Blautia sp.]
MIKRNSVNKQQHIKKHNKSATYVAKRAVYTTSHPFKNTIDRSPNSVSYYFGGTDLFRQYCTNDSFRRIMNTGKYVYIDGYLSLKSAAFCDVREVGYSLKADVISTPSKALLGQKYSKSKYNIVNHSSSHVLRHSAKHSTKHICAKRNSICLKVEFVEPAYAAKVSLTDRFMLYDDFPGGDMSFGETLIWCMKHNPVNPMTVEELQARSSVDRKMIIKYRQYKGEPGQTRPDLNKVIALCVAMKLYPSWSENLLSKAGYYLHNSKTDKAYRMILDTSSKCSVADCNHFLQSLSLNALTKNDPLE